MAWALGLRNPGGAYEGTRHNAGADALRVVATRHGASWGQDKALGAEIAKAGPAGLALPNCFMNESGKVGAPLRRRASAAGVVVVFHDEIELPPGEAQLKFGGGFAGHNGLRSLGATWGGPEFVRVRVGVGRPELHGSRQTVADWALDRPSADHRIAIEQACDRVADAFEALVAGRWEEAGKIIKG